MRAVNQTASRFSPLGVKPDLTRQRQLAAIYTLRAASKPKTSNTRKITTKMKNKIRAMSAVAAEIPVKPKTAATIEIRRNMRAHLSKVMNVPRNGQPAVLSGLF
jgi:hypothetical protein